MSSTATTDKGSELRSFMAGVGSGLTKMAVGHPFDTVKTRLQCSPPGVFSGPIDCLRKTLAKEKILALYKGGLAPAISWGCSDALLMGSLHNYRLLLLENRLAFFTERQPDTDTDSPDKRRLTYAGQALAGMGAGWTNGVVAHPAELVKVRLQNQLERNKIDRKYSGPWPIAREVYHHYGVKGLYRGYTATLLFRSQFAVLFSGFELCMRQFARLDTPVSLGTASFISGGVAATFFWTAALPFDNIKNRLMFDDLHKPQLHGVVDTARKIYASGGIPGFFKGYSTNCCNCCNWPMNLSSIDEKYDNDADVHRTIYIDLDKVMTESYVRLLPALLSWPEKTAVKYVRSSHTTTNNVGHGFITFPTHQKALEVLATVNKVSMPGTSRPFKGDWAINAPHLISNPFTRVSNSSTSPDRLLNEFSVFVGDLSPDATEHDLMRAFQHPPNLSNPFTTCTNVKIMTDNATGSSRCFGFVRFSNEDEMARALDEMQGIPVAGRPIRLSTATPKIKTHQQQHTQQLQQNSHLPLHPTPHIYPLNAENSMIALDEEAERRTLHTHRQHTDQLNKITNFNSTSSSLPSSTASHIANAAVANASSDPHNTTVFVGGLSSLISEDTLRVFFAPFGAITYVKIPPGKGCGFVQFVRKADAERAIERMQGFPIGGGRIRLSWGRSQSDKAAQAAAQAAQLGLGIGALGQMANLTPSQAMQLSNALQNLGNAGVTNTSVHNAIKHLAAATSGMRGQGESPSQSPASTPAPPSASGQVANNHPHPQQTPSLYNPNLDVFQPQENKQQFQRQPSPLGQVNFAGGAGAGSSASAPSSASVTNSAPPPANRTDPIFYMPSDKANFPDFSVMERERSLFKSFMKPESPGTPASTASYKSPTTAASFEDNFTTLTSPNPTNPMPSPPLKAMPANTLESFFKSREHNREQNTQQNIQQQHIHQSQQQLNQQQQQ
ncbi:hypothetical protein E3P86_03582, partial [Wallemia ichthyophaga]